MIASASVTENGAEATIANTTTASGYAERPERSNHVLDLGLKFGMTKCRERKRRGEHSEGGQGV